jgi:hypothetical protein
MTYHLSPQNNSRCWTITDYSTKLSGKRKTLTAELAKHEKKLRTPALLPDSVPPAISTLMPDPIIIHHRRATPPLSTRATHQHNAMDITVVLHLVNKDEPINQALACLASAGAVTLAPGTYVVDNRLEYATTKADD